MIGEAESFWVYEADENPKRKHHWDGGWVEDAIKALDEMVPRL